MNRKACTMVMYPHVLDIVVIAFGLLESVDPIASSVPTFSPTCWFVIAWFIPVRMMYTDTMMSASTNTQTGMPVGHTSMTMMLKTNMLIELQDRGKRWDSAQQEERERNARKMMPYHHSGTWGYLAMSRAARSWNNAPECRFAYGSR
jgi:hypothetical protein